MEEKKKYGGLYKNIDISIKLINLIIIVGSIAILLMIIFYK